MTKITYNPQSAGDPETVEWAGRTFKKGEAQDFDGREKAAKGFIELARGNPHFDVDGDSENDAKKQKPNSEPETAEQYRAYALDWIKNTKTRRELEGRWNAEQGMREDVGWGSDDQSLIDPIYQPRLENFKRAENDR